MKNIYLIILSAIPFFGKSQTLKPLDSLTWITFGANRKAVIASIKAIGGIWDTKHSDPQFFIFAGVPFDQDSKSLFVVKFTGDIAYEADYVIIPNSGNAINYYDGLVKKINDAFGEGSLTRNFNAPYKDGDGKELEAIKAGAAEYSAFWPYNGKTILIAIGTDLNITLTIQDDALEKQAIAKQKAGN